MCAVRAARCMMLLLFGLANAHMTMWHPSVYGFNDTGLQNPLGPGLEYDEWWFRGPATRATIPQAIFELPAGQAVTIEIACNRQYTSYGTETLPTAGPGVKDACTDWGPYHTNNPNMDDFNSTLVNGCALAIADVDDINKVTMNNLVVFTVQQQCIVNRHTSFQVPAMMPPCSGKKCICAWLWQPMGGTGNGYMTGFDCAVTGSPVGATPMAPPQIPTFCAPGVPGAAASCVSGSKQPLYVYNLPSNLDHAAVPASGYYNSYRPGYVSRWSYNDGAQNDIFLPPNVTAAVPSSTAVMLPTTTKLTMTTTRRGLLPPTSTTRRGLLPPLTAATAIHAGLKPAVAKARW